MNDSERDVNPDDPDDMQGELSKPERRRMPRLAPMFRTAPDGPAQYPYGKLAPDDDGQATMEISVFRKRVIVRFSEPCAWIGLTGDGAMEMAQALVKHAREAGCTKPFELRL